MATCGSLRHIFENPLPETPTLLESLSPWHQIKALDSVDQHSSFTEIFGELYFKQSSSHQSSSSSSSSSSSGFFKPLISSFSSSSSNSTSQPRKNVDDEKDKISNNPPYGCHHKKSQSLQLCTEGLGFESFDDVEGLIRSGKSWQNNNEEEKTTSFSENNNKKQLILCRENYRCRRSKSTSGGEFPPPISCIGKSGKPCVTFQSYRQDGRFILKEIKIPTHEFLHACRENGRLKLQFVQPNEDILEEEDDNEEEGEEEE